MKTPHWLPAFAIALSAMCSSCGTLDKASMHGLNSGFYSLDKSKVYLDVTEEYINVHTLDGKKPEPICSISVKLPLADSAQGMPITFSKQSLDIDITSIPLKYRPTIAGLPAQLTTDLNFAMYAGWRHDHYRITGKVDPLGNRHSEIQNFGFDFGVFAGPGATSINPFTTKNRTDNDYSGMILQAGLAGFLESNMASFGLAVGFDYLLSRDRKIWIYHQKPWLGFIIGVALN